MNDNEKYQAALHMIGELETALLFYAHPENYFMREQTINLNQTTAVFNRSYQEKHDLTKENLHKSRSFEVRAKLKVDQGKTAQVALGKLVGWKEEHLKKEPGVQ